MLSTEDLHFRSMIERLSAGILVVNRERILFVNPAFREITGYSCQDLGTMGPWDMVHPDERETIRRRGLHRLKGEEGLPERYETRWIHKDGRTIWVDVWASLLDRGGDPAILVTVVDITARKAREEELEHSRDMQGVLNEVLALSLQEVSLEEVFSRTLSRLLSIPWLAFESKGAVLLTEGDPPSLVLKAHIGVPPETLQGCSRVPFGQCLCGRAAESQQLQFADRIDERHEICHPSMTPHGHYCVPLIHGGRTLGVLNLYVREGHVRTPEEETFLISIADTLAGVILRLGERERRMRSEEELRKSAERFRLFFDLAPDGVFLIDFDGRFRDANRAAVALTGYRKEEVMDRSLMELDLLPPDDVSTVTEMLRRNQRGDMAGPVELTLIPKDGDPVAVEARSIPITIHEERMALGIARDITERRRMEEQLHRERAYFEGLFRASPDAIVMVGQDGRILQVNRRFEELFQYSQEEAVGARVNELIVPEELADEAALLRESVLKGETVRKETRRRRKDGSLVDVSITGYPIEFGGELQGRYFIYRDITDRLRLEEELRQAQKMEAVGRLASGVAHDFNNTLTTILGYATIISTSLHEKDPLRDAAEEIRKAAERAAGITRQLLAFSRKQVIQPKVVDLNALIQEMEKMLRRLIGEDVELVTSLAPDLGRVEVDPGQMDQVILNLAVNARDAMPRGGKLIIETANVDLDEEYGRRHGISMKSGSYVRLAVTDTGVGMDREVQSKIFDPFFTTKEPGRGTGLGLSTVYGIVKQSGGYIWVYSEPGRGSTFKIYLPRVDKEAYPEKRRARGSALLRGSETVLLVEDDEMVRDLARQVLELYGYRVIAASGGREALELCRSGREDIRLLLTDVVMPDMSGRDLAEQLQSLCPGMKVLYMSGYTDDIIAHHGVLEPGMEFLEKPFTPESLAGKVREVLGYHIKENATS